MAYNVGELFKNYEYLIKVKTKSEYADNTERFKADSLNYLSEILDDIDQASDKAEIAKNFAQDVFNAFEKRGKVKETRLVSINYYMIYFIFPTILSERTEDGEAICEAIKTAWNEKFKCNISYADYNTLNDGFVTKLFGIPVGAIGFGKKD